MSESSTDPNEVPDGYVAVTFHVLEEDLVRGLCITLLEAPGEGLVPHTWLSSKEFGRHDDYRPSTITTRRDDDSGIVDMTMFGGTLEQLRHTQEQHARLMPRRGLQQGVVTHRPRAERPKNPQ